MLGHSADLSGKSSNRGLEPEIMRQRAAIAAIGAGVMHRVFQFLMEMPRFSYLTEGIRVCNHWLHYEIERSEADSGRVGIDATATG